MNRIFPTISAAILLVFAPLGAIAQTEPPTERAKELAVPDIPGLPGQNVFPGEFALRTPKGFYITAINGGGRTTDPVVVSVAASAGAWEKFKLALLPVCARRPTLCPPHDKTIQTSSGNFLTAIDGGGRTSDVLHTDATQAREWEQFRIHDLSDAPGVAPTYFAIQTISGNYLTAVGAGGKYEDAFHTDAAQIGLWERIRIVKCGDLGSGYQYTIIPANDSVLTATNGGGLDRGDPIVLGYWPGWSRFKLIRQSDGSYALQTYNAVNYVTALGGGGQVQKEAAPDCELSGFPPGCASLGGFTEIFHTDATWIQAWEKFKFIDQGNCKYAIQTVSGYYVGIFKSPSGYTLLTTDRSTISENEKFQLVMYGLASPAILH